MNRKTVQFVFTCVAILCAGACSNADDKPAVPPAADTQPSCNVFESTTGTWQTSTVEIADDEVLLPMRFLEKPLGMTRKALPDGRVGICYGDLCVPMSAGNAKGNVRQVGDDEYVPMQPLVAAIGGRMIWDAESKDLLLDFAPREMPAQKKFDDLNHVTLVDLDGKPQPLSAFRGKKALLFAWASW